MSQDLLEAGKPSGFGKKGFASASSIEFAKPITRVPEALESAALHGRTLHDSYSESSSEYSSDSTDERRKRRKHSDKKKRDRKPKKKHRKKRSSSTDDARLVTELDGVFVIDRYPDRESVSFGTVLDAPLYKSRDSLVSLRHTLGAAKLLPMEREWLTHPGSHNSVGVEYQIAGVAPKVTKKSERWKEYVGRYYIPGAIPARTRLNIANSGKRLARQRQVVLSAAKAAEREQQYIDSQQRNEKLAAQLSSSLGTKVIAFTGTTEPSRGNGPIYSTPLDAMAWSESSGFIPMDPPGVDVCECEAEDDAAEPDNIVKFQREQLALQSEGLLTPAFGESVAEFVRRRAKELNQATSDRPFDEAVWLDLAAFQPLGIDSNVQLGSKLKRRDAAVLDKQIAIYERGLTHCPQSLKLAKAMLRACHELHTREQMEVVWRRMLDAHPAEPGLWTDFIDYVASLYSVYTVPSVKTVISNALATIQAVQRSEAEADRAKGVFVFESGLLSASFRRKSAMLAVIDSCSHLLAAGGLAEHQIALWQALLEFNINPPPAISKEAVTTRLRYFEAFWESDYQRIGDAGSGCSCGWATWLQLKLNGEECDPASFPDLASCAPIPSERDVWGALGVDETIGYFANAPSTESIPLAPGQPVASSGSVGEERIEMVYSALHGYRIPMRVSNDETAESTSTIYEKILGELREESGSAASAAAKAERLAQKTLAPARIPDSDPLLTWLRDEEAAMQTQRLPKRSCDAGATSFQIVPFDSLSGLLFDVGKDVHVELVVNALTALGLGFINTQTTNMRCVQQSLRCAESPHQVVCQPLSGASLDPFSLAFQGQTCHVQPSLLTLSVDARTMARDRLAFTHNLMEHLLKLGVVASSSSLLCVFIEFQGLLGYITQQPDGCRERVKSLLSQPLHSSNLRLWVSFAAMEYRLGNAAESKRVLEKTAALSLSLGAEHRRYRFHIWSALVTTVATSGSLDETLHVLCGAMESVPHIPYTRALKKSEGMLVPPTRVMKARAGYQQCWNHEIAFLRASMQSLLIAYAKAVISSQSSGQARPDLTSIAATVKLSPSPHSLFTLDDVTSSTSSSLFPLSTFALTYGLFEYYTQGFEASSAVFARASHAMKCCAAALLKLKSCLSRQEDESACSGAVTTILSEIASSDHLAWVGAFASVGRSHSLPQSLIDDVIVAEFPLDGTDGYGRVANALLRNAEWLSCWWLQLCRYHSQVSTVPPRITRQLLEECLCAFPNNSLFLSLYVTPQRHVLQNSVRVKQLLERFTSMVDCPVAIWPHLLYAELQRATQPQADGDSVELLFVQRITKLFEQAVSSRDGSTTVVLWRMYLRFLLVSGHAAGARKVLFRAMHHCPSSKQLWLDSVRRFRPYMTQDELMELLRIMVQKGLSIRVPVKL